MASGQYSAIESGNVKWQKVAFCERFACILYYCLSGLSDELKEMKAEREKNKGNEAFRASDFDEALVYYSRSLSLLKTVAAHNNRAQTCMCCA